MITRIPALLLLLLVVVAQAVDYCKIPSCRDAPHTSCTYKSPQPSSKCTGLIKTGLTSDEKKKVLDAHNRLRQRVASGKETQGNPGPQPAAKKMPNLEWDNELEAIAQRWASQCDWGHDKCRNTERFQVGQNIAYIGTTANVNDLKVESMVQNWYNEVKDFNRNDVPKFRWVSSPMIGHYSQLVWGDTTKIGCGATKYKDGGFNKFYLVCNYGPTGNWIGEPVYST